MAELADRAQHRGVSNLDQDESCHLCNILSFCLMGCNMCHIYKVLALYMLTL